MVDSMDLDDPRGSKRKADEIDDPSSNDRASARRRIKALDPDVVNKIAAGEIIVAPVQALKELIENAVDAGSTALEILVKDGGLKLLQITDNGCGIDKEDLPILCERFTTSKLQKFEDLESIATYGFRGEALASISHIAHLTVTTKTANTSCAWRAHYDSGKLSPTKPGQSPDPKPVAGRPGTQITVEDLFYNVPTRRRAFRSASEEYNKIIDMVGRYAVHCSHVAFSCKKHGEASASISIQANPSAIDRVRQVHGNSVANELIEFSASDSRWGFEAKGLATNANYSTKKTTILLFINHRSVESTNVRKSIEQTYAPFLPKGGHPFVYLSLEIDPRRVDVNIHPTKREVNFLNEDEIIQAVCQEIRSSLAAVDTSRTFLAQTLLPSGKWGNISSPAAATAKATASAASTRKTPGRPERNDSRLVRTDTNLRKITSMLHPVAAHGSSPSGKGKGKAPDTFEIPQYKNVDREVTACRLLSVRELRAAVREDMHHELTEIFATQTFVGIIDEQRRLATIQSGVKLFLIDYGRACSEYFYQLGLTDFGNFGTIRFSPALDLRELLEIAVESEIKHTPQPQSDDVDPEELIDRIAEQLIERREMLLEYFSLEISPAGELMSIPLLIKGYSPPIVKLPQFLLRLGPRVDWNSEKNCFDTFLKELASFYTPERLPVGDGGGEKGGEGMDADMRARREHVRWAVEHILFPAFKARLVATNGLMQGGVVEVANLKGLYRVFERC